jgi:ectoine hydroxylase-related dioxygenase (phytanoyl-CoA dioxygenase family)
MTTRLSDDEILGKLDSDGYLVVPGLLSAHSVAQLKADLVRAIDREAEYHGGVDYPDFGMVLVCSMYGRSFIDVLAHEELMRPMHLVLGEGCIIYAYTSSSMPPGQSNYSHRIHVDSPRLIPGYETNMGMMMLLDDFTEQNGATWVLPGSHRTKEPPAKEQFFAKARRFIAPAGSACYFSARLWHSGGKNETNRWRHSTTINMCRPYMKQRIDIPRIMQGMDLTGIDGRALQKLGFLAQVPASLDEYYLPPEQRKFRQKPE